MGFSENDLVNYISAGNVPQEAMIQLNSLLFKELKEYCNTCEDDRMICVLSPQCPKRILLKVRLQAGAALEDLPQFCYSQAVNNIKRYLNKNTTLYTPQDELVYNKDFIEIMFPRMYSKIVQQYKTNLAKVHELIGKSKIPAVNLDIRHGDRQIFQKIIARDKVIREGTFIYDFSGEFLIIWFERAIFISNFLTDITIVNAKEDIIQDLRIIDLVFHTYCAEMDISGTTTLNSEHQISLIMKIPFDQIQAEYLTLESSRFSEIIAILEKYFFMVGVATDSQNNLVISLKYQNIGHFLKRNLLSPLNYYTIYQIVSRINGLRIAKELTP